MDAAPATTERLDIDAYCARVGHRGPRTPDLATLAALARCQPQALPFENLSVASGGVPELDLPALQAKLVASARGGYCYEQNALLQAVLGQLGFTVTGLSARVRYGLPPELVTPRSHMVLCVELPEGRYLVDAGFGGMTLTAPVKLQWHTPQPTTLEPVRLVPAGGDHLLQVRLGDDWVDLYRFDLAPQLGPDYVQQNWHTATRPNALFAHNLIATRPVEGGRHALFNRTLTWRPVGGPPQRRLLASDAALRAVLGSVLGLALGAREFARVAAVARRGQAVNPSFD